MEWKVDVGAPVFLYGIHVSMLHKLGFGQSNICYAQLVIARNGLNNNYNIYFIHSDNIILLKQSLEWSILSYIYWNHGSQILSDMLLIRWHIKMLSHVTAKPLKLTSRNFYHHFSGCIQDSVFRQSSVEKKSGHAVWILELIGIRSHDGDLKYVSVSNI